MMKKNISIMLVLFLLFMGCGIDYRDNPNCEYLKVEEFREKGIEILPTKEISMAGKIYVYKDLLLVQEKNEGIHIIDNKDKNNPLPKVFLKIIGNIDMAVKDGYLYADSYMDLLVIDINNLDNIKEVYRTEDAFTYESVDNYYCGEYDRTKGILIVKGDEN